jgi:hypothetical protein
VLWNRLVQKVRINVPLKRLNSPSTGIVRAVEHRSGRVFLLTGAKPEELDKIRVLTLGQTPLPECLLLKQSQMVEGFIPYIYNTENETVASRKIKKLQHYKT